jgi:enoyl-CoA hydratase
VSLDGEGVLFVSTGDRIATVTLNRPEARNALNRSLRKALWQTMEAIDADKAVDVVVLTGADPAFCAGLDLKELGATGGGLAATDGLDIAGEAARPFPDIETPLIAAVNGVAVTGGFELALACDFIVASEHARFADTHARVGIQPGWGLTVALPQAIGLRRARELSFTGNYLDAETARDWGLVNHVVPHDELLFHVRKLAADIVGNDRDAVARIRKTYADGSKMTTGDAGSLEAAVSAEWLQTVAGTDVEERRRAVIERGRQQL